MNVKQIAILEQVSRIRGSEKLADRFIAYIIAQNRIA